MCSWLSLLAPKFLSFGKVSSNRLSVFPVMPGQALYGSISLKLILKICLFWTRKCPNRQSWQIVLQWRMWSITSGKKLDVVILCKHMCWWQRSFFVNILVNTNTLCNSLGSSWHINRFWWLPKKQYKSCEPWQVQGLCKANTSAYEGERGDSFYSSVATVILKLQLGEDVLTLSLISCSRRCFCSWLSVVKIWEHMVHFLSLSSPSLKLSALPSPGSASYKRTQEDIWCHFCLFNYVV